MSVVSTGLPKSRYMAESAAVMVANEHTVTPEVLVEPSPIVSVELANNVLLDPHALKAPLKLTTLVANETTAELSMTTAAN